MEKLMHDGRQTKTDRRAFGAGELKCTCRNEDKFYHIKAFFGKPFGNEKSLIN